MTNKTTFTLKIGDWSGDGHGKCQDFNIESNKSLEEVREAYFLAKEKLPLICPETFVNRYNQNTVPEAVYEKAKAAGYGPFNETSLDDLEFWTDEMCDYVVWFITQGDPELELKILPKINMFHFYGKDDKNRHIGYFGYGLCT